jgi:uncharacterized phage protein (TIGR02218 family)
MITNTAYYRAIKLISRDKNFGFTDHPEDIIIDDTTYNSTDTIRIANIELNSTLSNTYTTFITYAHHHIDHILQYDSQFMVEISYIRVTNNKIDLIKLKTGKISEMKVENNKLIIEITSILSQLSCNVNAKYTTNCKACFGDNQCKLTTEDFIINNVKVTNATKNCIHIDITHSIFPPKLHHLNQDNLKKVIENGFVLWNDGVKYAKIIEYSQMQLKIDNTHNNIKLFPGDYIQLQCQCNKSFTQCQSVFSNQMQFRGEILFQKSL